MHVNLREQKSVIERDGHRRAEAEAKHQNAPWKELGWQHADILRGLQNLASGKIKELSLTPYQFNKIGQLFSSPSAKLPIALASLFSQISKKSGAIKVIAPQSTPTTVGSTNTLNNVSATMVITGSTGSDTLYGGSSADSINGGGGADYIFGGNGDDLFYFTPLGLSQVARLDGGPGTDTIVLTEAGNIDDSSFVNVNSVEVITLSGASTLTLGQYSRLAGINNVILGAGATTISLQNLQFQLPSNDTLVIDASAGGDLTLVGGWGSDVSLTVASIDGVGQVFDGSQATISLMIVANANAQTIIGALEGGNNITGGGGADSLMGGYQSDNFYIRQQDLASLVSLSSAWMLVTDPNSGETYVQDGTDTVVINEASAAIADSDFLHVSQMDYLQLTGASSATLGTSFLNTGIGVVIAGSDNTQITAEADLILDLDASQMADGSTLTLAQESNVRSAYSVSNLQADLVAQGVSGGLDVITAEGASISIQSSSGSMSVSGGALSVSIDATPLWPDVSLTLSDGAAYTVQRLVADVDASLSSGLINLSLSDASDGQIKIITGSGGLTLVNGSGNDTVSISGLSVSGQLLDGSGVFSNLDVFAGEGNQIIRGGYGADKIMGGDGADQIDLSQSAISIPIDGWPIDPNPTLSNSLTINLDQISYTATGQTGVAQSSSGSANIIDTSNLDIVSGLGIGGAIQLYAAAGIVNQAVVSAGQTLLSSSMAGGASLVTGMYDSVSHQFAVSLASDSYDDLMFQWADGVSVQSVVLSGDYFDSGSTIKMIGNAGSGSYLVSSTLM